MTMLEFMDELKKRRPELFDSEGGIKDGCMTKFVEEIFAGPEEVQQQLLDEVTAECLRDEDRLN
jgi:hypothetical protein